MEESFNTQEHPFNAEKHTEEESNLRDELLSLSENGEIKYTEKYIKKASQKTLQKIKDDYKRKQLKETNEAFADIMISKFSELMERLDMIGSAAETGKKLQSKKLLRKDLTRLSGYLTPYIPFIGILEGGLTVGGDIIAHAAQTSKQPSNQPE